MATNEGQGWTGNMPWIGQYILDENGDAVRAPGLLEWAKWLQDNEAQKRLAMDRVGDATVSTVFLGLDQSHCLLFNGEQTHEPILWETMILGGPLNLYQRRYSSKEAALSGHKEAVRMVTDR